MFNEAIYGNCAGRVADFPANGSRQPNKCSSSWICAIFRAFCRDASAVTAIEYGLIAGIMGLVTATAMTQIGSLLSANYLNILASLF